MPDENKKEPRVGDTQYPGKPLATAASREQGPLSDWWPCACVKGGGRGKPSTHIRLNAPTLKQCRACGVTKEESDRAGSR